MSEDLLPADDWLSGATSPSAIVNDNARRLEVALKPALSFESSQPGSPAEGDLYVLSAAWGDGVEHDLAYYFDGAWTYWTPFEGQIKEIGGSSYRYEAGAWGIYAAGAFASIAVQFTADLDSTADSKPGAGLLKWNHATQASATQAFVDDDTADGVSLTALWAALSAGGFLYLQHQTDQDLWQIWEVSGVVDATGYAKLTVGLLAKSTANFVDADPMLVHFEQGATSTGLADGDYGDITVSGSGAAMTIDAGAVSTAKIADDAVTYAKMQNVSATDMLLGRSTAGAGDVEEIACTAAGRALLDDANAAAQRTTLGLGAGSTDAWTTGQTMPDVFISDAAGVARDVRWQTAGSDRWIMRCEGTAESGSNAGSDWQFLARSDAGAALGMVCSVVRATQVVTFNQSPLVPTATAGDDSTKGASTAFVWGASATIRQNSQSAAYTLVASDAGKHILHPSADTTARIFTIPANSSVAFPVGTAVTFINQNAGGVITIAITTDTMRLAGAGTTGSRTLAANGVATAIKITTTEWIISGTGLT